MTVDILNVLFSFKCNTLGHYFLNSSTNLHFIFYLSVSLSLISTPPNFLLFQNHVQGGSNMSGTDLCVNKPHCAAAVRP